MEKWEYKCILESLMGTMGVMESLEGSCCGKAGDRDIEDMFYKLNSMCIMLMKKEDESNA